jgi:rRNA processing protein Krr1/Pno1
VIQGNTVSIISSSWIGLKQARRVIIDCMKNIHPVYHLKRLMIMKELQNDPSLQHENWERFLPKFNKKNVPRKSSKVKKTTSTTTTTNNNNNNNKSSYTPFPPPQTPRKIDHLLDTGEYFVPKTEREIRSRVNKQLLSQQKSKAQRLAHDIASTTPPVVVTAAAAAAGVVNHSSKLNLSNSSTTTSTDHNNVHIIVKDRLKRKLLERKQNETNDSERLGLISSTTSSSSSATTTKTKKIRK